MIDKADLVPHDTPNHTQEFFETLTLLRLATTDGPVFFVISGIHIWEDSETDEYLQSGRAYFYEEYSCPTNFIDVEAIYTPTEDDPHGVFEHVRTIWTPKAYPIAVAAGAGDSLLRNLFPETVK